jgi:hypothetical protein
VSPRANKAKAVCLEPGCPELVTSGRCFTHRRQREIARGSRQQRGYDAKHDRAKRDPDYLAATVCLTCERPFTPDNPKTAGHLVDIRSGGRESGIFPQCRRCNYGWRTSP